MEFRPVAAGHLRKDDTIKLDDGTIGVLSEIRLDKGRFIAAPTLNTAVALKLTMKDGSVFFTHPKALIEIVT